MICIDAQLASEVKRLDGLRERFYARSASFRTSAWNTWSGIEEQWSELAASLVQADRAAVRRGLDALYAAYAELEAIVEARAPRRRIELPGLFRAPAAGMA